MFYIQFKLSLKWKITKNYMRVIKKKKKYEVKK